MKPTPCPYPYRDILEQLLDQHDVLAVIDRYGVAQGIQLQQGEDQDSAQG